MSPTSQDDACSLVVASSGSASANLHRSAGPPPPRGADQALAPEDLEQLRQALQMLAGMLSDLLQRMLDGQRPSTAEIDKAMRRAGARAARSMRDEGWLT